MADRKINGTLEVTKDLTVGGKISGSINAETLATTVGSTTYTTYITEFTPNLSSSSSYGLCFKTQTGSTSETNYFITNEPYSIVSFPITLQDETWTATLRGYLVSHPTSVGYYSIIGQTEMTNSGGDSYDASGSIGCCCPEGQFALIHCIQCKGSDEQGKWQDALNMPVNAGLPMITYYNFDDNKYKTEALLSTLHYNKLVTEINAKQDAGTYVKYGGSQTGSAITPVYINSSGVATACSSSIPSYGTANSTTLGLVKSSTTGTTGNRYYNVQVNTDGTMKVNVPWTDTYITYTLDTAESNTIKLTASSGGEQIKYVNNVARALSADKLNNTAAIGSTTQPVYFNASGVPVACNSTLGVNISGNAATATTATSATKATQDSDGNAINTTYLKRTTVTSASGETTKQVSVGYTNSNLYKLKYVDTPVDDYDAATKKYVDEHSGNYISYTNNSVSVAGTTKTVATTSPNALYVSNGLIMGGTAAAAGLVTRGICGVSIPTTDGACTKDNLYLNYDGTTSYTNGRKVVLGAGSTGTALTGGAYTYCAVRGDEMAAYVTNLGYLPKAGGEMTGVLDMGDQSIELGNSGVPYHIKSNGTNNLSIISAQDGSTAAISIAHGSTEDGDVTTFGGPVNMSSKKITNLAIPTDSTDGVNKSYVDTWKAPKITMRIIRTKVDTVPTTFLRLQLLNCSNLDLSQYKIFLYRTTRQHSIGYFHPTTKTGTSTSISKFGYGVLAGTSISTEDPSIRFPATPSWHPGYMTTEYAASEMVDYSMDLIMAKEFLPLASLNAAVYFRSSGSTKIWSVLAGEGHKKRHLKIKYGLVDANGNLVCMTNETLYLGSGRIGWQEADTELESIITTTDTGKTILNLEKIYKKVE